MPRCAPRSTAGAHGGAALRQLGRGALARDYAAFVLPASQKVLEGLADLGVPRIHFGVGTGELLGLMAEAGADVVGVDWRVPISEAATAHRRWQGRAGEPRPGALPRPGGRGLSRRPARSCADVGGEPGHIFNLGHGVLPETDPECSPVSSRRSTPGTRSSRLSRVSR